MQTLHAMQLAETIGRWHTGLIKPFRMANDPSGVACYKLANLACPQIQHTLMTCCTGNLLMRVAHALKRQTPLLLSMSSKRLGLTGHCIDSATGSPNRIDHTTRHVASQLEAARRSPEAAIKQQHRKIMLSDHVCEPCLPRPRRGIEFGDANTVFDMIDA